MNDFTAMRRAFRVREPVRLVRERSARYGRARSAETDRIVHHASASEISRMYARVVAVAGPVHDRGFPTLRPDRGHVLADSLHADDLAARWFG